MCFGWSPRPAMPFSSTFYRSHPFSGLFRTESQAPLFLYQIMNGGRYHVELPWWTISHSAVMFQAVQRSARAELLASTFLKVSHS